MNCLIRNSAIVLLCCGLAGAASADPAPVAPRDSGVGIPGGAAHVCDFRDYPVPALQHEIEGTTVLSFTVSPEGKVVDERVAHSSGDVDLDNASIACASKWLYRPAMRNGVSVAAPWEAQVQWRLGFATEPYLSMMSAALKCVLSAEPARDEYLHATLNPVVRLTVSKGAVTATRLLATSGNDDLDRHVLSCFAAEPKALVALVPADGDITLSIEHIPTNPNALMGAALLMPTADDAPVDGNGSPATDMLLECHQRFATSKLYSGMIGPPHIVRNAILGYVLRADIKTPSQADGVSRLVCWQGGFVIGANGALPPLDASGSPSPDAATARAIEGWRARKAAAAAPLPGKPPI